MPYYVSSERLGWPRRRWWHVLRPILGELQTRTQYDLEPREPTATCHLQLVEDRNAACGHPWELLVRVPNQPRWGELPDWLRCHACEDAVGDG